MTRRALLLFALMSLIWGIPYLLIRVAVAEISPATLVFARTAIGAAILLPIAFLRIDLRQALDRWRWVVAFAVVEIAIPWVLLGWAEQRVSSSLAGLLVAGVPLVGAVIAVVTGGTDRVGRRTLAGLLIGLAGVAAIVGGDLQASNAAALLAIGVVILGYALGPAILSRRLGDVPGVGVMAVSLVLCALLYAPVAAVQRPATMPSIDAIVAVLILGVVCTAAAFVLFAELIREIGPVRSTVITYVNPAVAAVLGVLILDESLTPAMIVGLGLVIAGSALATRRSPSTPSDRVPAAADAPGGIAIEEPAA